MSKRPMIVIRWRWACTLAAALTIWSASQHTARHTAAAYPWPSGLTLPLLWLSALSITFLAVMAWVAVFHRQRVTDAEPPTR